MTTSSEASSEKPCETEATSSTHCPQPKIVERAFTLPVVSDTYSTIARLSSPLQPYYEKTVSTVSPIVDSSYCSIKSSVEEKMPEAVSSRLATAKEQVFEAIGNASCLLFSHLDYYLCNGLDHLVDKVPALKETTPALWTTTKTTAARYATMASTYLASFTLAQLALKISESGLDAAGSLIKLCPWVGLKYVDEGIRKLRNGMDNIRQEGAKINGTEKVKALDDSSLLDAVADVLRLEYFVSLLGGGASKATGDGVATNGDCVATGSNLAADETDEEKTNKITNKGSGLKLD